MVLPERLTEVMDSEHVIPRNTYKKLMLPSKQAIRNKKINYEWRMFTRGIFLHIKFILVGSAPVVSHVEIA